MSLLELKVSELKAQGLDRMDRPVAKHVTNGMWYCTLAEGLTFKEVLAGEAELYCKGFDREGEPSHPVPLVDDTVEEQN